MTCITVKEMNNSNEKQLSFKLYPNYIIPYGLILLLTITLVFVVAILSLKNYEYVVVNVQFLERMYVDEENHPEARYILNDVDTGEDGLHKCNNVIPELRFDCHPEDKASQVTCEERGCCWNPNNAISFGDSRVPLNVPYCYYPNGWHLYEYDNISKANNEFIGVLKKVKNSPYKNDVDVIKMETVSIDGSILRVKIYDLVNKRFEPPWPSRETPEPDLPNPQNAQYNFQISSDHIRPGFKVARKDDNTPLFDSIGTGGFIFANQFLQINALIPTHNIYGIGEHRSRLKLNTTWQSFTFFNKDQPPVENANLYGSHPFYIVIEESGNCHGVLFLNSNAMEVILQPSPAVTFRSIGGIFDMYFFMGPSPADVIKQYSKIVGKPFFPPYWSLGFHLCRYGYGSLEKTMQVWNRTRAAGIPFDTQWNDLDYMKNNNDFTYDKKKFNGLPEFINHLHAVGMHYIPLIDAGISASEPAGSYIPLEEGLREGIFVKDGDSNEPFVGKVWNPVSTTWPDFTNPKTMGYYTKMMGKMHADFPYDGAWIDMNEPSNFYDGHKNGCTRNDLDYPEYVPKVVGSLLATKTLCMNARHYLGTHYDLHNTYGMSHAIATNYALTTIRKKRPFIISRSSWVGHGFYAGHWSGDVYSSWHDMRMSIPEILTFNFYQIPMIGADICGFNGNTTVELCNRWMQLGAFYPFSRNHNSDEPIEQDPVAMGDLVIKSSKKALLTRYRLLPYLYTLFFRAHKFGETVVRPLFFEFIHDSVTYDIDTQFLWGDTLMVIPVLEEGKIEVTAYLPRGLWYNYYEKNHTFSMGQYLTLQAPLDTIPLLIRGGRIIPAQKPAITTTQSRKNAFELIIALNEFGEATGEIYWDDGDSLDSIEKKQYLWEFFTVEKETLFNTYVDDGSFPGNVILDDIIIMGVTQPISRVIVNNKSVEFSFNAQQSYFSVSNQHLNMKNRFVLSWKYSNEQPSAND